MLRRWLLWRWALSVESVHGQNGLVALAATLAELPEDIRPAGSIQLMDAGSPFEPNPTVPTLVNLSAGPPEGRERVLIMLRRALLPDQAVWLVEPGEPPVETTLSATASALPATGALFVPAIEPEQAERSLAGLRQIVHRLRAPGGCPWDRKQTHQSLGKYVIEEAYEVVDAIEHHGPDELAEELGDLLLQVFLQSELAQEESTFDLNDVVQHISTKLIRRHPHVFGDVVVGGASDVEANWEALKKAEKGDRVSVLDGIPKSLPALAMAAEMQKRMRKAGFEWPDRADVEAKLAEELGELREAAGSAEATAELGDVLFVLTGLGGWLDADAEAGLRATNDKVDRRFRYVEDRVRERGLTIKDVPLDELVAIWQEAKQAEASGGASAP